MKQVVAVSDAPSWAKDGIDSALRHAPTDPHASPRQATEAEKDITAFSARILSENIPVDPLVEGKELGLLVVSQVPGDAISDVQASLRQPDGTTHKTMHHGAAWSTESVLGALKH